MNPAAPSPAVAHYRETFERLRPSLRGPLEPRNAAFARFSELGFPTTRDEAWKYTSLRRLESRRFESVEATARAEPAALLPGDRIVLVNGAAVLPCPPALAGFRISTLGQAGSRDDEFLRPISGLG
ncbi:MAG: hypothetical protein ACR2I8_05010, partial [Steroidobacteraceae bacterium]